MDKKKINVLMIEDDPFSVAIIKHYAGSFQRLELLINHAVQLEEAIVFLDNNPVDMIFLDYRVYSRITGLEVLQHLRAKGINLPVIIITGSGNEEVATELIKAGASDYLVKGTLTPQLLERAVEGAQAHHERFSRWHKQETQEILREMAIQTYLSGVCIIDGQGVINYVNSAFLKMWQYDNEKELIGKKFNKLLSSPDSFKKIIDELKGKEIWMGEVEGKRKDGSRFTVYTLSSFTICRENEPPCVMASFVDITKVKEEEEKRETLYKGIMEVFALKAENVGNIETAGHLNRISSYTKLIASRLCELAEFKELITAKYIENISYASMLHDVGKWRTPNEVLLKPTELTPEDWKKIKEHPRLGVEMLSPLLKDKGSSDYLKLVENVVLCHHERWDGKGYPQGLRGEEIPLAARIVALADAYEAITTYRCYRRAFTHEEAYTMIVEDTGKLDLRILGIFKERHLEFKQIKETIV